MGWTDAVFGRDVGIDLGATTTQVYVRDRGVVVTEPSLVTIDLRTSALVSVGDRAREMLGRTPNQVQSVRPIMGGSISDYSAVSDLLRSLMSRAGRNSGVMRPRLVLAIPPAMSTTERRGLEDAGYSAGARRVHQIDTGLAAAVGAGLPLYEAAGSLIVDVGGGSTDVTVLSLGGVVAATTSPVGGLAMDAAIVDFVRSEYALVLGERTSERVKLSVGSAMAQEVEPEAEVRGRDLTSGLPRTIVLSASQVRSALADPVGEVVRTVRTALEATPPELVGDIMDRGIVLSGGGAQLVGLADRIRHETGIEVFLAADPATSVITGVGKVIQDFRRLQSLLDTTGSL